MIDGFEWNGAPSPTEAEIRISKLERKHEENIEYICKQVGIKTPKEIEREQWETEHEYDPVTKTTKELRAKAIDGLCYNINHEMVYIGDNDEI